MLVCAIRILLAAAAAALAVSPAAAERRLALVAGIDEYPNLPRSMQLERAAADAEAVGDTLASLGFSVTRVTRHVTQETFLRRFAEFTRQIEPGDTALFFFAGHGIGLDGANYLIPSDVPMLTGGDERLVKSRSMAETDLISDIRDRGARITVMVIDACRDNPFPRTGTRSLGLTRGLARTEPAEGVFSIYSAGLGQTAFDRLEGDASPNSVFTRVFVEQLKKPGLHLLDLAETVREEVAALTKKADHAQVPAVYNQVLGARTVFLAGPPQPAAREDAKAPSAVAVPAEPPKFNDRLPQDAVTGTPAAPNSAQAQSSRPRSGGRPADARLAESEARGGTTPNAARPAVPPAAQRAVLLEETPPAKPEARHTGRINWRLESEAGPSGPRPVIKGLVEIPERDLKMQLTLKRDADKTSASLLDIDLLFETPASFDGRAISSVAGVLVKDSPVARSTPLIAPPVQRVTNGYFMIALANGEAERRRNLALLRDGKWFDIPIVYGTGRRAMLIIEKGTPGEQIFRQAMDIWARDPGPLSRR